MSKYVPKRHTPMRPFCGSCSDNIKGVDKRVADNYDKKKSVSVKEFDRFMAADKDRFR